MRATFTLSLVAVFVTSCGLPSNTGGNGAVGTSISEADPIRLQQKIDSLERQHADTLSKLLLQISTGGRVTLPTATTDSISKQDFERTRRAYADSVRFLRKQVDFTKGNAGFANGLMSSLAMAGDDGRRRFLTAFASVFPTATPLSEMVLSSAGKSVGLMLVAQGANVVQINNDLGTKLAALQETSDSLKHLSVGIGLRSPDLRKFEARRDSFVSDLVDAQVRALPEALRGGGDIVRERSQWERLYGCNEVQERRIRGRVTGRLWLNRVEPVDEPLRGVALLVTYADSVSPPQEARYVPLSPTGDFDFLGVDPHKVFDLLIWGERIEGQKAYVAKRMSTDSAFKICFRPESDGKSTLCAVWQPNKINECK